MEYLKEVIAVATVYQSELEGDLDHALSELKRNAKERSELESRIALTEQLLGLVRSGDGPSDARSPDDARGMTLHDAMVLVLRESDLGMLRAGDIAQEIDRRHLYRMRDGRPVEAQQIHARTGHYPHLFQKEGTFIKLAESAK